MNTILIGVDGSERSEDAIAFGGRLAAASAARVIVACACSTDREAALDTAYAMCRKLEGVPLRRVSIRAPMASPARALRELAATEDASLIVVGSTHTGRFGRVYPGSTAEKLLHGTHCAVAIVPRGYQDRPIALVGVAYDESDEAKAALALAAGFGAELELIGVVASDWYTGPVMVGAELPREEIERQMRAGLETAAAPLRAATALRDGDPADELAEHSAELDLLVTGSRGFGPLRSVLTGGVSGRVIRSARCPVIVVPRGAEDGAQAVA
jgi:nucleotide-binding universal stress UspA family protein